MKQLYTLHWAEAPPAYWHRQGPHEGMGHRASRAVHDDAEAARRAAARRARTTGRAVLVHWREPGSFADMGPI